MDKAISHLNFLMRRNRDTHKGENGRVLVVAGSRNLAGAAILASVSALRIGADIVTLACPEEVGNAINCYCPDIMTLKLPGLYLRPIHCPAIVKMLDRFDVLLIGNGIGLKDETRRLVNLLLKDDKAKAMLKVIDADAIKMLSQDKVQNAIFTPHLAEYRILLGNSGAGGLSNIRDNVILLKGKTDQVITCESTYLSSTGNPGMAKAGTGDVLAGITAGILAKTKDKVASARAAARLNGLIGDILLKTKKGYFYIASDLISEMSNPKVQQMYRKGIRRLG